MRRWSWSSALLALLALLALPGSVCWSAGGELEIRVIDKETRQPIAVRMHLKDQRGRVVLPKKEVSWKTHFVFFGKAVLELPTGSYTFEMERGPEYRLLQGSFTIKQGATDNKLVEMHRFVDMKKEGWWSGELHVHRNPRDMKLLMQAEDLHVAPVITWWNKNNQWANTDPPENLLVDFDTNRFYHLMAGEDERGGGALLYFNLSRPLKITEGQREYPSSVEYLRMTRNLPDVHVDVEKPFWWDVPLWLASGQVHSMGIVHNHMWRDGVLGNEAWGKARDRRLYPDPDGNGRWSLDIYHHVLNCGLRIPPSAGSASGVLPNPVGYNRVYVYCGPELSYEKWWRGLRAGQVVVTNGPLLRNPRANGQLPGHIFRANAGQTVSLQLQLNLSLRDKVDYLEVVQNGKVVHEVRLDEWAKARGKLPPLEFSQSGWALVRAIANNNSTFRFGSSGPFYVEIGGQPRISRQSAQFFLDWVDQRARQIKLSDPRQQQQVMAPLQATRQFWQAKLMQANVD